MSLRVLSSPAYNRKRHEAADHRPYQDVDHLRFGVWCFGFWDWTVLEGPQAKYPITASTRSSLTFGLWFSVWGSGFLVLVFGFRVLDLVCNNALEGSVGRGRIWKVLKGSEAKNPITAPRTSLTYGLGFRIWGLGFGVWCLGVEVRGLGFRAWDMRFGVWCLVLRL